MLDDDADCWVTVVEAGTAGADRGIAAAAVVVVADDTSDNCPASGSCSACFDSPECCLRNRLHVRCSASTVPSSAAVDSSVNYAVIDSRA